MAQFTYERDSKEFTLNFNPEDLGFPYVRCACSTVRFQQPYDEADGALFTELRFKRDGSEMLLYFKKLVANANRPGSFTIANVKTVSEIYPVDQTALTETLRKYGIV